MKPAMCNACYGCAYRSDLVFSAHSSCDNRDAHVAGAHHGIEHGWFFWPFDFDPVWLEKCDGFKAKEV